MALSYIASDQSKATILTEKLADQLLDYLATNLDTTIRYYALGMILNIYSNASYFSVKNAKSHAAGHLFLGKTTKVHAIIWLNGAIHT